MKLAVIPARGGSKRIPRKNIRPFCGKPIMAWSIEAALKSGCFDKIVVSTDDPEIASIAREFGAETPFVRPEELAADHAATIPVLQHAIRWFQQHGREPSEVCCVYATAPFVRPEDIVRGREILETEGSEYAFSVTSYPSPIQRAFRVTSTRRIEMFQPQYLLARSQDLEPAWHDAAQFYWGRVRAWLAGTPIFSPSAAAVILPRHRVQDIDTIEDWIRAEAMFKSLEAS